MASTHQTAVRVTTRGFSQYNQRHLIEPDSMWDGLNMHQNNGRLEQTPWVVAYQSLTKLTGETQDTPTRLIQLINSSSTGLQYLVVNNTNARLVDATSPNLQTYLPVVTQTYAPSADANTSQCLLAGFNELDFGADGDTITVVADTASTFKWQKNGGSFSLSIPIAAAVQISPRMWLYFQGKGAVTDYADYTPTTTWIWTRGSLPASTASLYALSSDVYGSNVIFAGSSGQIMRLNGKVVSSVGYTPVYGRHVAVFYGHLFVSQFYKSTTYFDAATTPFTVGWSHLNNPDQFFNTMINEADQKILPQQQFSSLTTQGITGMAPWRSLLYVFLADSIWSFQYVGLPNVFQASQLNSNIGSLFSCGVVRTPQAIYFIGRNDFYKIDEFEPVAIGRKVRNKFFSEIVPETNTFFQQTFGFYNTKSKEVVWTYSVNMGGYTQNRQVVYNEQTDDWYFRNMPGLVQGYSAPICAAPMADSYDRALYGYTQNIYADQALNATTGALKDNYSSGSCFTQPYFETPFLNYGNYFNIKQSDSLYIDAAWDVGAKLNVYTAPVPYIGNGSPTMTLLNQSWTPALADQRLSLPREAYRSIAYKFEFAHNNNQTAVYNAKFNLYQEFFLGPELKVEK